MKTPNTLTLRVLNNQLLASGRRGSTLITTNGGTIGNAESNHWSIQNQRHQIEDLHLKIEAIDSHFCISAYAPGVFLNSINLFQNTKPIRLQHDDIIELCDLKIKAQINENGVAAIDVLSQRPEDIISNHHDPLTEILQKEKSDLFTDDMQSEFAVQKELISPVALDPLQVLSSSQPGTTASSTVKTTTLHSNATVLEHTMVSNEHFNPENHTYAEMTNVAINPLFQGLQGSVPLQDSKEAYDFLTEIGTSIKTIIEGIQQLNATNMSLANKHLRPIEDNPLRLNLSYQETLNLLYANNDYSVHLSAPSAIAESLYNMQIHNEANQRAISEALSALLNALSPQALMARFVRYRRSSDRRATDNTWAWDMYSNYYNELKSHRQKGFDKLFWEIYEQAYDRELRRLQDDGADTV